MDNQLEQAITIIKNGNREEGKNLLTQIITQEPENEIAWLWLSVTLDDLKEKEICLQKVLEINPQNEMVQEGLNRLLSSKRIKPTELPSVEDIVPKEIEQLNQENHPAQKHHFGVKQVTSLLLGGFLTFPIFVVIMQLVPNGGLFPISLFVWIACMGVIGWYLDKRSWKFFVSFFAIGFPLVICITAMIFSMQN